MRVRTMYLFSDTAATILRRGRISGIGILNRAVATGQREIELTIAPLLIGAGGWNLHPEGYPKSFFDHLEKVGQSPSDS
jgi:hypothetical protein